MSDREVWKAGAKPEMMPAKSATPTVYQKTSDSNRTCFHMGRYFRPRAACNCGAGRFRLARGKGRELLRKAQATRSRSEAGARCALGQLRRPGARQFLYGGVAPAPGASWQ